MRMLLIALALILGCTCVSQQATPSKQAGVPVTPAPPASFYLTPDDHYNPEGKFEAPGSYWSLLYLRGQPYIFDLPNAPWYDGRPQAVHVGAYQSDTWTMIGDYSDWEIWDMWLAEGNFDLPLKPVNFSEDLDHAFITLWPVADRTIACPVYVDYSAPENYIYATIEPVGCDQIGKNEPFCITFYGSNLRKVGGCNLWFGIWSDDRGWAGMYADAHPDYPMGVYDTGKRRQDEYPLEIEPGVFTTDYADYTADSVYAQVGFDVAEYQGMVRPLVIAGLSATRDGSRFQVAWKDYLRNERHCITEPVAVYSLVVTTLDEGAAPLAGHSGPICNTVMTIDRADTYVLYYIYAPGTTWPHFERGDSKTDAICGPPVLFQVHEIGG